MYYTEYSQNFVGPRKNSFDTGRFANFIENGGETLGNFNVNYIICLIGP